MAENGGKKKKAMYKVVLLGNPRVGKSNLLSRLNNDTFFDENSNTVGIEFVTKVMTVDDEPVKVQIWDTAGQERYSTMMGTYYRRAKGALLLFSVADRESFEDAEGWRQQLSELADADIEVLLVGNKVDVEESDRQVSIEQAKALATKYGMTYIETSAKTGKNVGRAFQIVVEQVHRRQKEKGGQQEQRRGSINLGGQKKEEDSILDEVEGFCCST